MLWSLEGHDDDDDNYDDDDDDDDDIISLERNVFGSQSYFLLLNSQLSFSIYIVLLFDKEYAL